jgi:hypothetical protein
MTSAGVWPNTIVVARRIDKAMDLFTTRANSDLILVTALIRNQHDYHRPSTAPFEPGVAKYGDAILVFQIADDLV